MTPPNVQALVANGIAAFNCGDRERAYSILSEALQADPSHEVGWLWMSAVVQEPAERRFCLERVLDANPGHEAAQRGLSRFPPDLASRSPLPAPAATKRAQCAFPGCTATVSREGHTLCYRHWRQAKRPHDSPAPASSPGQTFRKRFPAEHRTTDGHLVRSRAEMLIDNWLYMSGVVHAYERQLPIEEEVYCDFYLPAGKVYLEYWGLENDSAYNERRKVKTAIYQQHGQQLIELTDEHLRNLDDHLPKLLLRYGISVE